MSATPANRPEKPKKPLGIIVTAVVVVIGLIIAGVLLIPQLLNGGKQDEANNGGGTGETTEPVTIKLGVNDAGRSFWDLMVKRAAENNIKVEIVAFTDYNTPNPALAAGDIDINKFQHLRYLAQFIAANPESNLVPLGSAESYPISLYSTKWKSLDEVPVGAEVTLSNNPANQVRPLLALQDAGLITLKGNPGWAATLDDVDYANSKIGKITPLDPTLTAASLDSVDLAFVDTPYANAAGLTKENKVYFEDPNRDDLAQYINIFATKKEHQNDPNYLKIIEIYQSEEFQKAIDGEDGGFDGIFQQLPVSFLEEVLAEQVKQFK
ncbi:MAG: MetQ/NlpA family ABC transporter substrate-binding protein [Microbacteriaceae bacterium]